MRKVLLLALLSLLIGGCRQPKKQDPADTDTSINEAIDNLPGEVMDKYNGKLNELLTLEIAAKTMGYEAAEAEIDYNKVLKNPKTHSIAFLWNKGREREIKMPAGGNITVPEKDIIQLSGLEKTSLEDFNRNYRTPTAEELKRADQAVKARMKDMVAEGKINSKQAGMMDGMATGLGRNLSYEEIKGVGEHAKWNEKTKELLVYYRGLKFNILIETAEDEQTRKQKSINVAKTIISQKLK